jgi:hypothetical protein
MDESWKPMLVGQHAAAEKITNTAIKHLAANGKWKMENGRKALLPPPLRGE